MRRFWQPLTAAGDFLLHLEHADAALTLVIGKRDRRVVQEAKDICLTVAQPLLSGGLLGRRVDRHGGQAKSLAIALGRCRRQASGVAGRMRGTSGLCGQ